MPCSPVLLHRVYDVIFVVQTVKIAGTVQNFTSAVSSTGTILTVKFERFCGHLLNMDVGALALLSVLWELHAIEMLEIFWVVTKLVWAFVLPSTSRLHHGAVELLSRETLREPSDSIRKILDSVIENVFVAVKIALVVDLVFSCCRFNVIRMLQGLVREYLQVVLLLNQLRGWREVSVIVVI